MSHCETKIGLGIDSEQKWIWLCKDIELVNQARWLFYLGIDFLKIVLLTIFMTHHDIRLHIFILCEFF